MGNSSRRYPGITARLTKNRGTVYEVRFRKPDGREASKTFSSLSSARRWQVEQQQSRFKGTWVDPKLGRIVFDEWANDWLQSNPTKRERTVHRDQQILTLINQEWSKRPLDSITPEDCRRLLNKWIAEGYAASTLKRMIAVIRAIFNAAVEADIIGRTPWRGIKTPTATTEDKPALEPSEVMNLAREVGAEWQLVVLTSALCGLRFGECAGLRLLDVDTDRSMLSIRQSLGEVGGRIVVNAPKSQAGIRSILMPDVLAFPLKTHIDQRRLVATDDEFVFVSPSGGPLRYGNFRSRVFAPACQRLGLPKVTFHDLRKFNATVMIASGVDVKTAQVRLGHSDPRLTLSVYAKVTSDGERRAVAAIESAFDAEIN